MSLKIEPTIEQSVTRITCPICKRNVKGIGLLKGSVVDGLTFKCSRCNRFWIVKSAQPKKAESVTLSASMRITSL